MSNQSYLLCYCSYTISFIYLLFVIHLYSTVFLKHANKVYFLGNQTALNSVVKLFSIIRGKSELLQCRLDITYAKIFVHLLLAKLFRSSCKKYFSLDSDLEIVYFSHIPLVAHLFATKVSQQ